MGDTQLSETFSNTVQSFPTSPSDRSDSESSDDEDDNSKVPIDAKLYQLLAEGQKDAILNLNFDIDEYKCKEEGNSVLHILASSGQSQLIVEFIPQSKRIIKWKNNKGDSPFHSAVKASDCRSLQALMRWDDYQRRINKELLGSRNHEGDTPLHIAVENNEQEMARLLVDEYFEACYKLNSKNESPLYAAIRSECWELVKKMINYTKLNKEAAENELLHGKSVVHAAIDSNNLGILKDIIDNHRALIGSLDGERQSPLCYAAFKGNLDAVEYLLKQFPEYAYQRDEQGSFPIHKAASGGNIKVIQLLSMTKKLQNRQSQNILHVAAASGQSNVVSYILRMPELEGFINHKDDNGNTPLHLASKDFRPRVVYILTRESRCNLGLQNKNGLTALDVLKTTVTSFPTFEARLTWLALRYADAPYNLYPNQKDGKTSKEEDLKELESFKERVDTHMLVATLVATVTFAAGFTLPGGYNQSDEDPNIGMAVLPHKWAFMVFIICNTAALYSSILSVVILIWAYIGDLKLILVSMKFALPLLGFALTMMSVAFMMGIFVVLRTAPWLSYVILGMGSVFVLGVLLFFIPLYTPSYIRNPVVRFFFSATFLLLLLVCEKSYN